MSELDIVYERLKTQWLADPAKLEHDEPLLARAFREAQPNRELETALEQSKRDADRMLAESTWAREILRRECETLRGNLATAEVRRTREAAAHATAHERLLRQLAEATAPSQSSSGVFAVGEQQQLAALGWRKGD